MNTTKSIYFIKQSADLKALDLYIYDYVQGDSVDWWTGEVTESTTSAKYVQQQLESSKGIEKINMYINSYGGDVKEGLGIYNQLKRHPAQKTAYIDGFACSIASVIPMSADKVIMGENTLMMIHHAAMGAFGNAAELRKAANDVEIIDQASCSSYLAKAGNKLTKEKLDELLDNQTWLNARQCLELGLADEIAGQEEGNEIIAAKQRFEQCVQAELSQIKSSIRVPEEFIKQKTNAEKLMMVFKKKMEVGK